jgi:prevent-host-death family protein
MSKKTYGAEEARSMLPRLIERAHHGKTTVITKRGRPYAAIVPVDEVSTGKARGSLLALAGTGRGLWGRHSAATVKKMRDEWS